MTAAQDAPRYPFSAVVGAHQLKLALILSAISPGIGGVLIRGEGYGQVDHRAGTGTLLAGTPGQSAGRVVELPIGATEDRVIGSLDLTSVLRDGRAEFTLACSHRPIGACSTSTRSTCSPTISSTSCSTPLPADASPSSATAYPTRRQRISYSSGP